MLIVTETAKEKFKETLKKHTTDLETIIRIIVSSTKPNQLEFVLDEEKEGDQTLVYDENSKVLVIEPELAQELDGRIIDYRKNSRSEGFTISMPNHSS